MCYVEAWDGTAWVKIEGSKCETREDADRWRRRQNIALPTQITEEQEFAYSELGGES